MKESSKSFRRRYVEHYTKVFPWMDIFKGSILDIGTGDDPLNFDNVTSFDYPRDANKLSTYFESKSFDVVHSSNCIEHMINPKLALIDWLKVLKKGGWMVLTFPSMELYGDIEWGKDGSKYNGDHKSTFSMRSAASQCYQHIFVPAWVEEIEETHGAKVKLFREVATNYDMKIGYSQDQTFLESSAVEAWIEMCIQKDL